MNSDRIPQRFQYRQFAGSPWSYGCIIPDDGKFWLSAVDDFGSRGKVIFQDVPLVSLMFDRAPYEFRWIDNDYGWPAPRHLWVQCDECDGEGCPECDGLKTGATTQDLDAKVSP
jgi:hypothetical protein